MHTITLEDVDKVRERAGVSYREARLALEKAGGDPVEALINLEGNNSDGYSERGKAAFWVAGENAEENTVAEHLKNILRRGHEMKICVHAQDSTMLEIPLTAGVAGAFLFPKWTAWGMMGLLAARCSLRLKK